MLASPGSSAPPLSRTDSGRISRPWLPLARGAWGICALVLLANFVANIPGYYRVMSTVCPLSSQEDCNNNFGQLAPNTVQTLTQLHLSLGSYAIYFVTLDVVISLLPWSIGLLLF